MIGIETSDDAAVYKLNEDTAIIETLDFFTPVVDDPYMFGQIAAANALSDVYAMGGKPIIALNIVCFPACLDMSILGEILRGGADKVCEAGAVTVGGHSIDDKEPKYGLSVTGIVHPDKVLPNKGAIPGNILILTKPIGTGIINTAAKAELVADEYLSEAVKGMAMLNKYAAELAIKYKIYACTDITGFGLAGHAFEMAESSKVSIHISTDKLKFYNGAMEYAAMGLVPGGTYRNKKHLQGKYSLKITNEVMEDLVFDPQTSGGLLYSMDKEQGMLLQKELEENNIPSSIIGYVSELDENYIYIE
jgi:selenide,water dikinase